MAKTPAAQLNNFLQKLAMFLQNNKPHYVKKYGVTMQNVPSGDGDSSTIRMVSTFEISNKELRSLEGAGLISDELERE